jgi:hypothetical protein
MSKSIEEMTDKEIEQYLQQKRKKKEQKLQREKKAYEEKRDKLIKRLVTQAIQLNIALAEFKDDCDQEMEQQHERLDEYGMIRGNSKGGFSITDQEDQYRIIRSFDSKPRWDERAEKAENLLREFFETTIKKRDRKLAEMLLSYMTKDKAGNLRYSSVMNLIQHEDKYDDPRWKEGIRLLKESYNSSFSKFYYHIQTRDEQGEWQNIELNFSKV